MTQIRRTGIMAVVVASTLFHTAVVHAASAPPIANQAEVEALDGIWLAQAGDTIYGNRISETWFSTFTLKGGSFSVSHFCRSANTLHGSFTLDPTVSPKTIDLHVEGMAWSPTSTIPKCTLPGIYKLEGNRLIVCFKEDPDAERPRDFSLKRLGTLNLTLESAGRDFKEMPKEIAVTVRDQQGKPVAGARVFDFIERAVMKLGNPPEIRYGSELMTGPDATIKIPYNRLNEGMVGARDADRGLIGLTTLSPASLRGGQTTVTLEPTCLIQGRVDCDELDKPGAEHDFRGVYLYRDGLRTGLDLSPLYTGNKFEFRLPPGNYMLEAYGEKVEEEHTNMTVYAGQKELQLPSISLKPTRLVMMAGKPAPEFDGVIAWKGAPVKLADLRGKYVLVDFWGYWCGPCVASMPALIELHERFKDKGLEIVTIHMDSDGEIDTVAKLDEKIAVLKKSDWNGKDLPFPVALISGKHTIGKNGDPHRGGAPSQYGILNFPTTILIDKAGNIVGKFQDVELGEKEPAKKMIDAVKKLLEQ